MEDKRIQTSILIVDDNPENLRVMEFMLENPELNIIKASSGEEALKALMMPDDFALIFMDVRMPGLDGFEAAALIRQREKCAQIPIIFLTAYGESETGVFRGYSLGAVDFIVKPIAPEVLKSKVSVFVDLHKKNKRLTLQEELLRQSHERLEARVQERTAQLNRVNRDLTTEVAERTRAETALKESLKEKEILLKEIHHRVKNNLQIISSILSLQGNYVKDPDTLQLFQESQSRIKAIALVHEQLYQADLASMHLGDYLENLVANLFRTYAVQPGIKYEIDTEDVHIGLDTAIHCGLMITELVTNSLKYGFIDRLDGNIYVALRTSGDGYRLTVSDDGVGIAPDIDVRNTNSLGLQLVSTLADQMGAEMKLEGSPGTNFSFFFEEASVVRR
ncbi:MAG: response regulator [Spirochaetia bacterium]|nr:response regulator [Spirochaetia bacterium]